MKPCRLLYFVKYPEPGKVKTRLARTMGYEAAAALYRKLAEKNFRVLQSLTNPQFETCVVFDPPEAELQIKTWLKGNCTYLAQRGVDLGERLANAFQSAFEGGAGKAMALGSDTLDLKPRLIEQTSEILYSKEVVIGPAKDGGYYLVGLSRPEFFIFKDIPWSTPGVLPATLQRVEERRLTWELLPELEDLDEPKDLNLSLQLE
ncbi:MAG: hypothetical protein A2036_00270 [Omnitrophica bacterium GWA2_50_21]|nr:MAG: hypothetical protein A2036_00270 [Omnitrophica bacterium GWA2_50_21]